MARYLSTIPDSDVYFGIRDVYPNFGTGGYVFFGTSGTFTIPEGVNRVRVTALGAGGGGSGVSAYSTSYNTGSGGGGGGYGIAVVDVTPGCSCTVTVGTAGVNNGSCISGNCNSPFNLCGTAGGTSQFGTAICALGGSGGRWCASCYSGYPSNCAGSLCVCGGTGGNVCITGGTTLICRPGKMGCGCNCCYNQSGTCTYTGPCPFGGASGSPLAGTGTGPWPNSSSTDMFGCRAFNGLELTELDLYLRCRVVSRWLGEVISSTFRSGTVNGIAAGNGGITDCCTPCYIVGAYGGAVLSGCRVVSPCYSHMCSIYIKAGCGGGGASPLGAVCGFNTGYGWSYCVYANCAGTAGNGFVVVEY